jgi:hypothetical protein
MMDNRSECHKDVEKSSGSNRKIMTLEVVELGYTSKFKIYYKKIETCSEKRDSGG